MESDIWKNKRKRKDEKIRVVNFRITEEQKEWITKNNINIGDTVRELINREMRKVKK